MDNFKEFLKSERNGQIGLLERNITILDKIQNCKVDKKNWSKTNGYKMENGKIYRTAIHRCSRLKKLH